MLSSLPIPRNITILSSDIKFPHHFVSLLDNENIQELKLAVLHSLKLLHRKREASSWELISIPLFVKRYQSKKISSFSTILVLNDLISRKVLVRYFEDHSHPGPQFEVNENTLSHLVSKIPPHLLDDDELDDDTTQSDTPTQAPDIKDIVMANSSSYPLNEKYSTENDAWEKEKKKKLSGSQKKSKQKALSSTTQSSFNSSESTSPISIPEEKRIHRYADGFRDTGFRDYKTLDEIISSIEPKLLGLRYLFIMRLTNFLHNFYPRLSSPVLEFYLMKSSENEELLRCKLRVLNEIVEPVFLHQTEESAANDASRLALCTLVMLRNAAVETGNLAVIDSLPMTSNISMDSSSLTNTMTSSSSSSSSTIKNSGPSDFQKNDPDGIPYDILKTRSSIKCLYSYAAKKNITIKVDENEENGLYKSTIHFSGKSYMSKTMSKSKKEAKERACYVGPFSFPFPFFIYYFLKKGDIAGKNGYRFLPFFIHIYL